MAVCTVFACHGGFVKRQPHRIPLAEGGVGIGVHGTQIGMQGVHQRLMGVQAALGGIRARRGVDQHLPRDRFVRVVERHLRRATRVHRSLQLGLFGLNFGLGGGAVRPQGSEFALNDRDQRVMRVDASLRASGARGTVDQSLTRGRLGSPGRAPSARS